MQWGLIDGEHPGVQIFPVMFDTAYSRPKAPTALQLIVGVRDFPFHSLQNFGSNAALNAED